MIKTVVNGNGVGRTELAGTPSQLAKEAAMLVQVLYNSLHSQNPSAGDIFQQTFCNQFGRADFWKSVPVRDCTPPRRPSV